MKILFLYLLCILFILVSSQQDYMVSDCRVIQNCKKCLKNEMESFNVCKETGYYQLVNCSLTRIEDVDKKVDTFRVSREGCKLEEFCSSIESFYSMFVFEFIMIIIMSFSCFYFYKRKSYLYKERQERYEKLVSNEKEIIVE
eukprot:gene3436-6085_t